MKNSPNLHGRISFMATIPILELLTLTLISLTWIYSLLAINDILVVDTHHYLVCTEERFFVGRYISLHKWCKPWPTRPCLRSCSCTPCSKAYVFFPLFASTCNPLTFHAVLTPYLSRIKVRKEKKLLNKGTDEETEQEVEEVRHTEISFLAVRSTAI